MAYQKVYFRIRTDCYNSGWSSDANRFEIKEESDQISVFPQNGVELYKSCSF